MLRVPGSGPAYVGALLLLVACSKTSPPPTSVLGWNSEIQVENHFVASAPGVTIGMARYRPASGATRPEAVVLLHGYPVNLHEFDADEPYSLARRIAEQGFDVWAIDWRGAELSPPGPYTDPKAWHFNFDDFIHTDLHAALGYILKRSGLASYFLVGHSLGGSAQLGYLVTHPDAPCAGAVLVAPGIFVPYPGWQTDPMRLIFWTGTSLAHTAVPPGLPLPVGPMAHGLVDVLPAGAADLTIWLFNWFFGPLIWSSDNTNTQIAKMGIEKIVSSSNSTVMRQLLTWAFYLHNTTYGPTPYEWHWESSAYVQANGFRDYSALLPEMKVPQLWMVGPKDHLVPPKMVAQAFAMSGAADKTLLECSKASGFAVDYGHADTIIGLHSHQDIYPKIVQWLVQRTAVKP